MAKRILVIDDDARLGGLLSDYLGGKGFDVTHRLDAKGGLDTLWSTDFDALILDVMLPDGDGFDLCREIRARSGIPIVMLTARGDDTDRIVGLELGADDYLPKPFNPRELLARVRSVLRRTQPVAHAQDVLDFGDLRIDLGRREVRVAGEVRRITGRQFDLLALLASRAGRVQSREQLMDALTGEEWSAFDRSIDVHVSRLRAAIEADPKDPKRIKSVRGVGYVFVNE